jgi:hypothetical protein
MIKEIFIKKGCGGVIIGNCPQAGKVKKGTIGA